MLKSIVIHGLMLTAITVQLAGCATRGEFTDQACSKSARMAVYTGAVTATYFDNTGAPISSQENLKGTFFKEMCPTPEPTGASGCPSGYCAYTPQGSSKTYCLKC